MHFLFDIGGTNIRLALVEDPSRDISIESVKKIPTPNSFIEAIQLFQNFLEENNAVGKIEKTIGGTTGVLDRSRSTIVNSLHLPEWKDKNLKEELAKVTQSDVQIENDAALAALGEATFGVGKDYPIVVYLTVSTGVGGGRAANKKLEESNLNFEIGHQIINYDGEPKYLEDLISGSGLSKKHGLKAEEITDSAIWSEVEKILAVGLNNILVHWSPDVVVIGGAVGRGLNLDNVSAELKNVMRIYPELPPIIKSDLRHNVIHGALYLLRESLNDH